MRRHGAARSYADPRGSRPSGGAPALTLVLYTRRDCHLCEEAKACLAELQRRFPLTVEERDVDDDPGWAAAHGDEVPVGYIGDRKVFKYRVDPEALGRALRARWAGQPRP